MNDDDTLSTVRNSLIEVRDSLGNVSTTIPASEIVARATRRRTRHRRATAGAACAAAAGLTLSLVLPSGSQFRPVHVHLAAWSVDTNPNGTVTFKLQDTAQPERLQHVLAEAGVPAMVRHGEVCLAQGQHVLLPTRGIVSDLNGQPTQASSVFLLIKAKGADNQLLDWSWTIVPSKIPGNSHFVISSMPPNRVPAHDITAEWEFVPDSAPVKCATSVNPSQ